MSDFGAPGGLLPAAPKSRGMTDQSVLPGFDHQRALSVIDNLSDTTMVTEKVRACLASMGSKLLGAVIILPLQFTTFPAQNIPANRSPNINSAL